MQGCFHLDVGQPSRKPASTGNTISSGPQVRIVENNNEFAVMEITCSCGAKTRVRCEYDDRNTN